MVLYKLIKSTSTGSPNSIIMDLGDTYIVGKVESYSYCRHRDGSVSSACCGSSYSLNGVDFTPLAGCPWIASSPDEAIRMRYVSGCGAYYCGDYNVTSASLAAYELLYTQVLAVSIDKTVVAPDSQFTVSGTIKDQHLNPMSGQLVTINVYKAGAFWQKNEVTTDSSGNFSQVIHTLGWLPDTYRVDIISDQVTQTYNVAVTYMSSVKFDAVCIDTGAACPADVYLDNILRGTTPLTLDNVPVGDHSYRISKTGYRDVTGTFTVQQGITSVIEVAMLPAVGLTGKLFITSVPEGAEIYLAYHGWTPQDQGIVTPRTIIDIPVGSYDYLLKKEGFKDYTGTVEITEATATVSATLTPNEGCVYFITSPPGAKILIDGVDTGFITPKLICNLSLGEHNYSLVLAGYRTLTGTFNLTTGEGIIVTAYYESRGVGWGAIILAAAVVTAVGVVAVASGKEKPYTPPARRT